MLHRLKQRIPESATRPYHRALAYLAALRYGFPSEKMTVIGVTGTNGKSTTTTLIAKVFEEAGFRVGATSTAMFKVAEREWLNDTKMTMLGRFALQRLLREMVDAGCTHAVVETSSQGVLQYRHEAINYDTVVFTNLTPEHLEAHGGFENYKQAKLEFFRHLMRKPHKKDVPKVMVVNADDDHAKDFLAIPADKRFIFTIRGDAKDEGFTPPMIPCVADDLAQTPTGSDFTVRKTHFHLQMPGKYNVSNALAALTVGFAHGVPLEASAKALANVTGIPGRLEFIREGQPFTAIVDYAPEPVGVQRLYEVIDVMKPKRLIHVLGSTGGGRDVARRGVLGELAGKRADVVIVTNEDPYDDDPMQIIGDVAAGARKAGKIEGENLLLILDRAEAIAKAVLLAEPGDLVLVTGKGCEQAMVVAGGKKLPWDDREQLRKAIHVHQHTHPR